jgi:hypothetical protein
MNSDAEQIKESAFFLIVKMFLEPWSFRPAKFE